jgi:hypothetical protein
MQSQSFSIGELEAFASKFYGGRALLMTPYGYNLTFTGLAPAATATQTLNIAANADFIALTLHHRANVAAAAQNVSTKVAPLARILVVDSGSNEQFTNTAVDLENYSTNGNIINTLPYPRIISGRSTLTVTLTNYDAASTYNIDVFFEGVLVRAYSN